MAGRDSVGGWGDEVGGGSGSAQACTAVRIEGDIEKAGTCARCGGTGIVERYRHIDGGRCRACQPKSTKVTALAVRQPDPLLVELVGLVTLGQRQQNETNAAVLQLVPAVRELRNEVAKASVRIGVLEMHVQKALARKRDFPMSVRATWINFIRTHPFYMGKCPACKYNVIVNESGQWDGTLADADHQCEADRVGELDGWPLCKPCHVEKSDADGPLRDRYHQSWKLFTSLLTEWLQKRLPAQQPLKIR